MNFSFEKIAPYLKDSWVLVGLFLLLAFSFFKLLVKKGVIPQLPKTRGYALLRLILWFVFILGLLLIAFGFDLKRRELLNQQERGNLANGPFLMDVEVMLPMLVEHKQWGFWFAYQSKHGNTLSPVHLALYVRFVNLQSRPVSISKFATEFHSGDENWHQLVPLNSRDGDFYMPAPDLHQSARVALSAGDLLEILRTRHVQPYETVTGWLFYEASEASKNCLASKDCRATQFRFHVADSARSEIHTVVDAPKGDPNILPRAGFDMVNDIKDLSQYYITDYSKRF